MKFFKCILFFTGIILTQVSLALNADDAFEIVEKITQKKYQFIVWSGMQSWQVADLNNDGFDDFISLATASGAKKSNLIPTHVLIIQGSQKKSNFLSEKQHFLISLDQGSPMDAEGAFVVSKNKKELKAANCNNKVAIKMTEEASTSFYLCYINGKYRFTRDENDTP